MLRLQQSQHHGHCGGIYVDASPACGLTGIRFQVDGVAGQALQATRAGSFQWQRYV
jgi:hypothetical protein